jgi:hypothetical protein
MAPEEQGMADHEHGLRYVDDEGRCLACGLAEARAEVEKLREELGMRVAVLSVLVLDFAPDGAGDVTGPHLAEREVWDALADLTAKAGFR